jgi:hypothetical protein
VIRSSPVSIEELEREAQQADPQAVAPPAQEVRITPPRMMTAVIRIQGTAPYCQHAFSEKARKMIEATQRAGQQARGRRVREAKNFEEVYEAAKHISREGWLGIPAPAFRNAAIDVCRLVAFKMTFAKLSIFVVADGIDRNDGMPLVKIEGEPTLHEGAVRNATGVIDLRWRPIWYEWAANVTMRWDLDQFSANDVVNLMHRAGEQCGIGEGRANSPQSNGIGWGSFEVVR